VSILAKFVSSCNFCYCWSTFLQHWCRTCPDFGWFWKSPNLFFKIDEMFWFIIKLVLCSLNYITSFCKSFELNLKSGISLFWKILKDSFLEKDFLQGTKFYFKKRSEILFFWEESQKVKSHSKEVKISHSFSRVKIFSFFFKDWSNFQSFVEWDSFQRNKILFLFILPKKYFYKKMIIYFVGVLIFYADHMVILTKHATFFFLINIY